jgi:hypothetical protein
MKQLIKDIRNLKREDWIAIIILWATFSFGILVGVISK